MRVRLLLFSHAATPAQRAGRFPADEALDARGRAETEAWLAQQSAAPWQAAGTQIYVSPAQIAQDTAALLAPAPQVIAALADQDYGRWQGQTLANVAAADAQALTAWMQYADAPAGGAESFAQLCARVGEWMDEVAHAASSPQSLIGISHAPVLRAAIIHAAGLPHTAFGRIEIPPLSRVELRCFNGRWAWWPAQ